MSPLASSSATCVSFRQTPMVTALSTGLETRKLIEQKFLKLLSVLRLSRTQDSSSEGKRTQVQRSAWSVHEARRASRGAVGAETFVARHNLFGTRALDHGRRLFHRYSRARNNLASTTFLLLHVGASNINETRSGVSAESSLARQLHCARERSIEHLQFCAFRLQLDSNELRKRIAKVSSKRWRSLLVCLLSEPHCIKLNDFVRQANFALIHAQDALIELIGVATSMTPNSDIPVRKLATGALPIPSQYTTLEVWNHHLPLATHRPTE